MVFDSELSINMPPSEKCIWSHRDVDFLTS